jgi:ferrous iron transport protein B
LGFDWKIGTALIGATAAKEVFVSQLAIVYAVGSDEVEAAGGDEVKADSLREKLQAKYTPLTGFCIMLFCLIYAPCVATIAMTKQETSSWGWALFQFFGLTVLAYILTLIVFQIGSRIL